MKDTSRLDKTAPAVAETSRVNLDPIFKPKSIAFIGASEGAVSGHMTGANKLLHERNYPGPIYPINPNRETVWGLKAYPNVASTPTVPELAMMAINQSRVPQIVQECAAVGVKAIIVDVLGYADHHDPRGRVLQDELAALVRQNKMLMVGPNTLGLANFVDGIHLTTAMTPAMARPFPGKLAIISQSGGNTYWLLEAAYERHIGVAYAVNSGNEATLTNCDFLEYLVEEPAVGCFLMYIEGIQQPERFMRVATRAAELNKPIVAVKIGRSETGRAGARAHTGSFSGPDEFVDALFARTGVIRAADLDDAMDKLVLFSQLPPELWPKGPRVATFVVGGGIAGLSGDLLPAHGLELPPLPEAVATELTASAPSEVTIKNPIDLMARFAGAQNPRETTVVSRGQYAQEHAGYGTKLTETFIRGCLEDPNFDAALVSSRTPDPTDSSNFFDTLEEASTKTGKPVVFSQPTVTAITDAWNEFASHSKLAVITGVGRAAVALQAAAEYHERRPIALTPRAPRVAKPLSDELRSAVEREIDSGKKVASYSVTRRLIEAYGVRLAEESLVADADAAAAYADKIGYPVVVKLAKSDALTHMTEVGGVRTNLRDRSEVAQAVREVQKRSAESGGDPRAEVLVQQMLRDATEIYIGGANPGFGYPPAVLVGLGGIFLEATRDVAMSLAPVDAAEARRMIERLRSKKILNGFRGRPAADVAAIVDAITRLSELVLDLAPFFEELDINPAMVFGVGKGLRVVDALLTYRQATVPVPTVEPVEVNSAAKVAT